MALDGKQRAVLRGMIGAALATVATFVTVFKWHEQPLGPAPSTGVAK